MEIPTRRGSQKPIVFKENMKLNQNFQWGEGSILKTFCEGKSMDIFWNITLL